MSLMIMEQVAQKEVSGRRRTRVDAAQSPSHRSLNLATRRQSHVQQHHFLLFALLIICCLPAACSAASVVIKEQMVEVPAAVVEVVEAVLTPDRSTLDKLAQSGQIVVDLSPLPKQLEYTLSDVNDDLQRRQELGQDTVSSAKPVTQTVTATVAGSGTKTTRASTATLVTAATEASSPLPSAFDSGFSSNITASCSSFMNSMLANATFKACLPVSLLLQVCNS